MLSHLKSKKLVFTITTKLFVKFPLMNPVLKQHFDKFWSKILNYYKIYININPSTQLKALKNHSFHFYCLINLYNQNNTF